jgi:hypothetical protein
MGQSGPDSGNALIFANATTNRVNIPDAASFDHPGNTITIEAWVNPTTYTADGEMIFSKLETVGTNEYYLYILPNGLARFILADNSSVYYYTTSTITVPPNTWTHLAATYSFATGIAKIYFNGILNVNNNIGSIILNSTNTNPLIGAYWLTNNNVSRAHFQGAIDEVRLWHIERTQPQIRDNMCQTLLTPQANLIAYYQLDETSGLIAADASGNGNNGTLENFPAGQVTARNYSGAPIGDVSINNYLNQPANWTGLSYTLNSTTPTPASPIDARSLTMDNITGTPDGVHIYRVNSLPSQTGGLVNPISTYFGTFVANVSTPATAYSYRATYDYTPYNNNNCIADFRLKTRNDNSVTGWTNIGATNNNPIYTLTATNNLIRREFILDTACIPLPIDLISFDVTLVKANNVLITWSTAKEQNNYAFYIERSQNSINFETIAEIKGNTESNSVIEYQYSDHLVNDGIFYYRIKQMDINGEITYYPIKSIDNIDNSEYFLNTYPNPANNFIYLETNLTGEIKITLLDAYGRIVLENIVTNNTAVLSKGIEMSELSSGIYFLIASSFQEKIIQKIIKE